MIDNLDTVLIWKNEDKRDLYNSAVVYMGYSVMMFVRLQSF
jgi:hypothetical protein